MLNNNGKRLYNKSWGAAKKGKTKQVRTGKNENATVHNMEGNALSTKEYNTTLLDMEDVVLKNIKEDAREITIEPELAQKVQLCPACGAATSRVHDYHNRTIRELDLRGKRTTLHYRHR